MSEYTNSCRCCVQWAKHVAQGTGRVFVLNQKLSLTILMISHSVMSSLLTLKLRLIVMISLSICWWQNKDIRVQCVINSIKQNNWTHHKSTMCVRESIYTRVCIWKIIWEITAEWPFICINCNKWLAYPMDMNHHKSTECVEMPFHCTVCKKTICEKRIFGNSTKKTHWGNAFRAQFVTDGLCRHIFTHHVITCGEEQLFSSTIWICKGRIFA